MKMQDEMPSRIRFHYDIDKKARLETVHGVWGGINPHGEIEMSFYNESDAIPSTTEQIVAPDGSLGHEVVEEDSDVRHINRHIHLWSRFEDSCELQHGPRGSGMAGRQD